MLGWAGFLAELRDWAAIRAAGCPTINYSNRYGAVGWAYNVFCDDAEIGSLAADKLLLKGYTRFAFVGMEGHAYSADREVGFRQALQRRGCTMRSFQFDAVGAENPIRFQQRRRAQVADWLRLLAGATGILAANDALAMSFVDFVKEVDVNWLPRLAVVGVDNLAATEFAPEGLTTIVPNFAAMGETIAKVLIDLHAGKPLQQGAVRRVSGARWVEGKTTAGAASDDPVAAAALREIALIVANGDAPRVDRLAASLHLSRRTLLTHFRAATGMSLRQYCGTQRIRRAYQMLCETDLSVAAVAHACGYSKQGDLTEHFRRAYGTTPRALRSGRAKTWRI